MDSISENKQNRIIGDFLGSNLPKASQMHMSRKHDVSGIINRPVMLVCGGSRL